MQTFEERHSAVDPDPLIELERRLQPWASAPSSRGEPLTPEAVIVPRSTVEGAVVLLKQLYEIIRLTNAAKARA